MIRLMLVSMAIVLAGCADPVPAPGPEGRPAMGSVQTENGSSTVVTGAEGTIDPDDAGGDESPKPEETGYPESVYTTTTCIVGPHEVKSIIENIDGAESNEPDGFWLQKANGAWVFVCTSHLLGTP